MNATIKVAHAENARKLKKYFGSSDIDLEQNMTDFQLYGGLFFFLFFAITAHMRVNNSNKVENNYLKYKNDNKTKNSLLFMMIFMVIK